MNKKLIDWWIGGASYDAAFQAVMSRWTALGYTHPSGAVLTSLNTLVTDLKAAGVWTGFDTFYVMMLNDSSLVSTTGAINYISPSANQMTFPVAPTYTTSGIKGNGSTQYASTNYNPSTQGVQFTRDSCSWGFWRYVDDTVSGYYGGASTQNTFIASNSVGTHRINSGSPGASSAVKGTGYAAIDRPNSSGFSLYNETTKIDRTAASAAIQNAAFLILQGLSTFTDAGLSMWYNGRSFSQSEHASIRTAFLGHKNRLGL